jgi:hypothetical protein
MGLMDKVKAQATQIAQKAQETAQEGKARLDQVQANRQADAMLRNLGALVYADRTNRGTPDTQDKINKLISQIQSHEATNGINLSTQSAAPSSSVPPQGGPQDGTQSGPGGFGGPESQPGGGSAFPPEA